MKVIKPYVYMREAELDKSKLYNVEYAARLCYKSEGRMTDEVNETFLKNIITRQHESVLEHEKVTVYFVVDRGITHEIVRHRVGSYSQESTRYCNYTGDKFGNEITVIEPYYYIGKEKEYKEWENCCKNIEQAYMKLLKDSTPQEARAILPNSLKTEIAVTYNLREWRHFFSLRCDKTAHPQMQQITIPLLLEFKKQLAPVFDDISYNEEFPVEAYGEVKYI
ncbi:MAG TPA: FAD-dependent thymidylate synthase [Lachnospiraceae bacterium]|nr:FAD-dependent thymidylate synthase [uncultured Lachnoclostridium sp.]HAU86976.1 FAD-dependent thymidylate synthase [Lachnospiraceae bacterium]